MIDVDFLAFDNSDPPQLWAWAGEYGDEASEPLFRLPSAGLADEYRSLEAAHAHLVGRCDAMKLEIERLRGALVYAFRSLDEYGQHDDGCSCQEGADECECGFCGAYRKLQKAVQAGVDDE